MVLLNSENGEMTTPGITSNNKKEVVQKDEKGGGFLPNIKRLKMFADMHRR